MRLLIADDEWIEREALKQIFASEPLGVKIVGEASNGLQVIERNATLKPDVILMDIRMGIMDGLKATELIKRDNSDVEIIILTAYGLFEYSQQALRYSVFDYLLKPVNMSDLLNTFKRLNSYLTAKKRKNSNPSYDLITLWAREKVAKSSPNVFNDERIEMVITYIMNSLDKQITLHDIAQVVHVNPSYLSRLFKNATGSSISSFIVEARVEKAKYLLKNEPDKALKTIAKEVGFNSVQHFCNTFKRIQKESPASFRSNRGAV